MKWQSTRQSSPLLNTSDALQRGLAEDGGLFMPESIPKINFNDFNQELSYPEFATRCLAPYFIGDLLEDNLDKICHTAFNFPINIYDCNDYTAILECFHGPTLAFKDFGARFLATCSAYFAPSNKPRLIMVATSGDTGSAVASAYYQQENTVVAVLYPYQKITERQEAQITCWGGNVHAFAVKGTFDDCQRCVKSAFTDNAFTQRWALSTANSINIGRLLPQIVYYAYAAMQYHHANKPTPNIIVPSGNLGNVTAAHLAKKMGFPIHQIVAVTNENKVLPLYCQSGDYHAKTTIHTLANAMDVGNPSNFERLQFLYPDYSTFKEEVLATSVSDEDIRRAITRCYEEAKVVLCPHTATAWHGKDICDNNHPNLLIATAHPAKFETVIEPILGFTVDVPKPLQQLLDKPRHSTLVDANLEQINNNLIIKA